MSFIFKSISKLSSEYKNDKKRCTGTSPWPPVYELRRPMLWRRLAELEVGFYYGKCGIFDVESIVAGVVKARFFKDPTIAPALIRMQFYDCFVSGCDASLLLTGSSSERFAAPNLSVRGYECIDEVKAAVESFCPGLVACADIIAIATRDAIFLSGGGRYRVQTGRRDGLESLAENVDLPGRQIPVSESIAAFTRRGLGVTDMVYLLGGHTVGVAHCLFFQDRLYNFQNSGRPDPTMDWELVKSLRSRCPQNSTANNIVSLDQNFWSSSIVENSFYKQILRKRGVLQIDQWQALDPRTRDIVTTIASGRAFDFGTKFGEAMVRLGVIQVLTGTEREIRKSCSVIN